MTLHSPSWLFVMNCTTDSDTRGADVEFVSATSRALYCRDADRDVTV